MKSEKVSTAIPQPSSNFVSDENDKKPLGKVIHLGGRDPIPFFKESAAIHGPIVKIERAIDLGMLTNSEIESLRQDMKEADAYCQKAFAPVSYTHLTLPTKA